MVEPRERPQVTSQYGAYALHAGLARLHAQGWAGICRGGSRTDRNILLKLQGVMAVWWISTRCYCSLMNFGWVSWPVCGFEPTVIALWRISTGCCGSLVDLNQVWWDFGVVDLIRELWQFGVCVVDFRRVLWQFYGIQPPFVEVWWISTGCYCSYDFNTLLKSTKLP